jgi:hypothetical protein
VDIQDLQVSKTRWPLLALHFLQNQRYWFETFGLVNVFCQKADFGNQE